MAKPEWGHKRLCQSCGARFYDLRKDPITCPSCGAVFDPLAQIRPRRARAAPATTESAAAKRSPIEQEVIEDEVDLEEDLSVTKEEEEEEDVIEDAAELGEDEDVSEVVVDEERNE